VAFAECEAKGHGTSYFGGQCGYETGDAGGTLSGSFPDVFMILFPWFVSGSVKLLKYIKAAFWNRWHLLSLTAGVAVSMLAPGGFLIGIPLVVAAEVAYLGLLGTHPKFRKYIEAQEHKLRRETASESNEQKLHRMLQSLPRESVDRYERLRTHCTDLREIAIKLQRSTEGQPFTGSLDTMQLEGLDRLLWIFLRLLFTKNALAQFLHKTDTQSIENEIERIHTRLASLDPDDASGHSQKLRRTLEDNLATCKQRLGNYEKARSNHEFVGLELDRLENKIQSLAELSVNRREHDFISSQVDEVAHSMVETEKTMSELQFATGFEEVDETVPELVRNPVRAFE